LAGRGSDLYIGCVSIGLEVAKKWVDIMRFFTLFWDIDFCINATN
jgi:hypothetical protein